MAEHEATISQTASSGVSFYDGLELTGPHQIRVLTVLEVPAKDETSTSATWCDIRVIDFASEETPQHTSLSYSWSKPYGHDGVDLSFHNEQSPPVRFVTYQNRHLQIGENLFQALLQLFEALPGESIWIDAVCINQADLAERNAQVGIMGDIYATAKFTMVWLGLEDEDSEQAIPLMQNIVEKIEQIKPKDKLFVSAASRPFNDDQIWSMLGLTPLTLNQWKAIVKFFVRGWFRRLWVVQEAVLSGRVGVLCGKSKSGFTVIAQFAEFVCCSGWQDSLRSLASGTGTAGITSVFEIGIQVNHFKRGLQYPKQRQTQERFMGATNDEQHLAAYLAWLWTENRQRLVTDPKDRIFAPLALASRLKSKDIGDWIQPDYEKSISDVYVEAANFILRNTPSLSQLSFVEDRSIRILNGLPSWVPDYTAMQYPPSINTEFAMFDASFGWGYSPGMWPFGDAYLLSPNLLRV